MSLIEQGTVPAGWYPDHSGADQLRWWDGETWGDEVRPLVIDMVPDFSTLDLDLDSGLDSPLDLGNTSLESGDLAPSALDLSRLAPTPEPSVPAPTPASEGGDSAPLTRRQLRELLGGPLTTDARR